MSDYHGKYDYRHREREKRIALERMRHQMLLEAVRKGLRSQWEGIQQAEEV